MVIMVESRDTKRELTIYDGRNPNLKVMFITFHGNYLLWYHGGRWQQEETKFKSFYCVTLKINEYGQ